MAAQALYRKWRPQTLDEVVGQEHVIRTLRNALTSGRIHHAYLFAGPRGTGKTTTARLLAKAVNCLAAKEQRPCNECEICQAINQGRLLDLIEIDAASNTGVDDVRELRERVGFRPNEARYKVYVIDEVHMLSNAAFNALLKTLEEPPEHAIFVLATTEPHKILPTVLSRCQRFDFRRIPISKIVDRLEWLVEQEGIRAEKEALRLIARQSTGSMRDAESLLDQLASYDDEITVEEMHAALGIGADDTVVEVTRALAERDMARGLGAINAAVDEGADPRQFARQIVEHLRTLLLLRLESDVVPSRVSDDMRPRLEEQAVLFSRKDLAGAVRLFNEAVAESRGGWQPQLPLEMAFIEVLFSSEPEAAARNQRPSSPSRSSQGPSASSTGSRRGASPKNPTHSPQASDEPRSSQSDESVRSSSPSSTQSQPAAVQEPSGAYGGDKLDVCYATVQDRWSEVLNALRPRDLSLEALMRSCEPMDVQDNVVVLGFTHKFHRSKVEEDEKRRVVENVLSDLFGQRVRIRCVLSDQRQAVESSSPTRKDSGDAESSQDEQLIAEDPVVRVAVENLGAEVVNH